jgi:hypothetical protein
MQGKEPKPAAWTIAACIKWLLKNKIPSNKEFKEEIPYVRSQLNKYKAHVTAMVLSDKATEALSTSKNWCTSLPFLRLYDMFMDKEIQHKLVTLNVVKSREELDSRNSVKGGTSFFEDATAKFNDVDFVPEWMALPDLHEDFAVSKKLYLLVDEIDAEDVKKGFTNCRGKLIKVKTAWERTKSGKVMATAADGNERARMEKEVYEFKDGDDRQRHLYTSV